MNYVCIYLMSMDDSSIQLTRKEEPLTQKVASCLLHFGIREQKQILIIENRFIVFQNIPH